MSCDEGGEWKVRPIASANYQNVPLQAYKMGAPRIDQAPKQETNRFARRSESPSQRRSALLQTGGIECDLLGGENLFNFRSNLCTLFAGSGYQLSRIYTVLAYASRILFSGNSAAITVSWCEWVRNSGWFYCNSHNFCRIIMLAVHPGIRRLLMELVKTKQFPNSLATSKY